MGLPVIYLDSNLIGLPADQLGDQVQIIFQQLEDQLNGGSLSPVDATEHGVQTDPSLHALATPNNAGFMSPIDAAKANQFLGETSTAAPASLTEYPNDGDYGFHTDTGGSTYSFVKNKAGTLYTTTLT